ncbi:MAG: PIN domain-containing protein [Rhizobiaceae bacterium]
MFVDTSALVAIIAREPDRENYIAALAREDAKFTSPLVILEATMVLSSRLQVEPQTAFAHLIDLLKSAHVEITPIEAEHAVLAVQAFATYGKDATRHS